MLVWLLLYYFKNIRRMKTIFLFAADVSRSSLFSSMNLGGKLFTCLMIGLLPWMMAAQSELQPEPEPREAFSLSCLEGITSAPGFPIVEVQVNVHFIGVGNNKFIPDDPENLNDDNEPLLEHPTFGGNAWNGNLAARAMIERANLIMSNLNDNPLGFADFLGDSRIRFKLYSEASNTADKYGGIWYRTADPAPGTLPYGKKVVHIIVRDEVTNFDGQACNAGLLCNHLYLNNWHKRLENGPNFEDDWYGGAVFMAKVLIHEIGHITGLCHSFNSDGQCSIDLDIAAECNIPGVASGGGCGGAGCNNGASLSTNIMGYNGRSSSLSPCQWRVYYGRLLGGSPTGQRAAFVELAGCEDPGNPKPPITIPSGSTVTWSSVMVIDEPVIVESNATLIISCLHFFGKYGNIQVRRGGKLKVIGGTLMPACGEPSWEGIFVEGNANEDQPDPAADVTATNDWLSGVVYLDGAYISGAYTAVNTWQYGQLGNPDYWGGVVYAKSSTFENNRRGAAFMLYSRENKSAFTNGCMFREQGNVMDGTRGVSIWGCTGIDFTGNFFENLDVAGIYGIDFGITNITLNRFEHCYRGIEIYSTLPISANQFRIGDKPEYRNRFLNNVNAGIYVQSSNRLSSLQVFNNYFESSGRCVNVAGPAKYDIRYNTFNESSYGFYALNTGQDDNHLWCNAIRYPGSYGTYLNRDNRGLELKYNVYAGTATFRDNTILGSTMNPDDPGAIFSSQGTDGDPADNCFSAPDKAFGTIGFTTPFRYYVPFGAVNTPQCNVLPSALPMGIELVFTTDNEGNDCDNEELPELPVFTKPELDLARQVATQTEVAWQSHPTTSAYNDYQQALRQKNAVLQSLLAGALDAQNYTAAATLLAEESAPEAQQWLLNVKLLAKDFTGAQQVWNALPSVTQEEQWFRDIMEVNLQRLQNMGGFSLSALQLNKLYTIAYSESPYRSYARSLLVLLKEERFPLDEAEEELPLIESPNTPQMAIAKTSVPEYKVAPNPASETVQVRYPAGIPGTLTSKQLHLVNLNGLTLKQITLDDSGLYDLQARDFPPGIYLLRITDKTGVLYQTKLVLLP